MSLVSLVGLRHRWGLLVALLLFGVWLAVGSSASATVIQQAVGGVAIDANGMLTNIDLCSRGQMRQLRLKVLETASEDLAQTTSLRKVSLQRLDEALRQQLDNGKPLTEAMKHLAGLQRIEYIFVFPDLHDVILAGPAEGWKVDAYGDLVGITSGRPVMALDDLVVALRCAKLTAQTGISCSIDPTQEGMVRLKELVAKMHNIGDPETTRTSIEKTLGPQSISVNGVPATSHFAQVLVAADYRMKRLAMNFDPSPVRGLPSFLQMIHTSGKGMSNMLPRWWLTPLYQPVVRDPDGLSWQLRVNSVKALTEEDFLAADGTRQHTGHANPVAQKWADNMTAKYDELAVADPIFGRLRNCMELAVLAALVVKEDLHGRAGCSLPTLMDTSGLPTAKFPAPRQVDSQASMVKKGSNWVISASGGVQINSWGAVEKAETSDVPAQTRAKAIPAKNGQWWWN